MIKLHTAFRSTYDFHVKLLLRTCELLLIYLLYALIVWSMIPTRGTDVALHCRNEIILTSSNYPSYYPNGESEEWYITAPSQRRILVTFNDFNLEDPFDFIYVTDIYHLNVKRYTGENARFPPFLTQGHILHIDFTSSERGRRKGFNISVSCYKPSKASSGRLVGGASSREGFLELPSNSGKWMRVCEENLLAGVAEMAGVICGEFGYPGVKEISFENDTCLSDDTIQNCTRAPRCQENMYRLQDCIPVHSTCSSNMVVKIKCLEPGGKGCYIFEMIRPQNGFTFKSTAQCISSCKTGKIQAIAIMSHVECFCSTAPEVSLEDAKPLSDYECTQRTENESSSASQSKMWVYNASVGFCDELNDTLGGSWDSSITWFGSIVHLSCMNGYSLNGSGTLQCVPGSTPYYPVWNDSISTCDEIKDNSGGMNKVIIAVPITVCLLVSVLTAVFWAVCIYRKRGGSCQSCHPSKRKGAASKHQDRQTGPNQLIQPEEKEQSQQTQEEVAMVHPQESQQDAQTVHQTLAQTT